MKQKTKRASKGKARKGSALLLTTILLFVVLSMVVSLTYVTVMEQKMSQKTKSSVGAFYNSESGIEWALNQIATSSGPKISNVFPAFSGSRVDCPASFGGANTCQIYLLDADGKIITDQTSDISLVRAVRSVGTQNNETTRAIEAAVAAGGSGCYVSYKNDPTDGACITGFKNMGSAGQWGNCHDTSGGYGVNHDGFFRPPGGGCEGGSGVGWVSYNVGEAFVCCK